MKSKNLVTLFTVLLGMSLTLTGTRAQQPEASPSPKKSPEAASAAATKTTAETGDYTALGSLEIGYRGLRVGGDVNKFRSDLNYKAGPRLFDSSLYVRANEGKGELFDSLLITSTGWGADPHGNVRFSVEKPKLYRFDGNYRRFKYFRFLNTIANPNWIFSPANFSVPPNPVTGEHGFNSSTQLGDFDLTLLPKNRLIRFNVGFSPESYSGPAFTNYHVGGNEFMLLSNLRSKANDYRLGADGTVGPIDFSFLQGFRRFRDDSFIDLGRTPGINLSPAVASFNSFLRNEPTRGSVNFTRFSLHTLVAKKLDITGRIIHSNTTSNSIFLESFSAINFNTRITGQLNPPNLLAGQYNITGNVERPSTLGDIGLTWLATDKLRISNSFKVERFEINGLGSFSDAFFATRAPATSSSFVVNGLPVNKVTKYRKYQNTFEGDYQFNDRYSMHLGYRYGSRRIEEQLSGFSLNSNAPVALVPEEITEQNHTHAFFAGFKARPVKTWTIFFDAERGTSDNVFSRIGNYNYTNLRAKSRYAPNRKLSFNVALITKNNANPSEIAGVSLQDFGVDVKSRIVTTSVDWAATSNVSFNAGYNYSFVDSDAVVDYFYNSVRHPLGHSLYFVRNNFFYLDTVARLSPRFSLFASYRINRDHGQGNRLADPTGAPGTLISSYPMNFQSPEARLAIKLHRRLDWNLGYQYYNYSESTLVGPRPQNYHAHLPYTSLRVYFGRKE
jgi:hypothetical protein